MGLQDRPSEGRKMLDTLTCAVRLMGACDRTKVARQSYLFLGRFVSFHPSLFCLSDY